MSVNNEEKRSRYHLRQRRGMQDLRFMMLLYALGLLLYTALGYFLMSNLTQTCEHFLRTYLLYSLTSFLIWCIPIRMLWNFNRLGRILFFLCTIASFYVAKDIPLFYAMEVEPAYYKYGFLILFGAKFLITLLCAINLSMSYTIRSIWSMDDMFDEELEALPINVNEEDEQPKEMLKWEQKASRIMKKTAIRLAVCLYVSILIIFIFLNVLSSNISSLSEGLKAIQMPLFSECLFTGMMWSVPVIGLYLGKKWSPYLIYVAVLAELIRVVISFQTTIRIFTDPTIPSEIQFLYIGIEVVRYLILYLASRMVLRSRLIKEYMHEG